MNVHDYCRNVEQELTAWKAKLYDLTRKVDALPGASKEKVLANVEDLHMVVTELDDRIAQLRNECPTEWSPEKKEIDDGHVDMRSKYEETMKLIGDAAPVSIPG
jgi:flagellar hook-length control protein FliK